MVIRNSFAVDRAVPPQPAVPARKDVPQSINVVLVVDVDVISVFCRSPPGLYLELGLETSLLNPFVIAF